MIAFGEGGQLGPGQVGCRTANIEKEFYLLCHVYSSLKGFHPGAQVKLVGPAIPWLAMQLPILLCDVFRIQNAVLVFPGVHRGKILPDEIRIDGTINNRMGDMYAIGSEFPRHALSKSPQGKFCAGEGGKAVATPQRCRCTGKNDGAL